MAKQIDNFQVSDVNILDVNDANKKYLFISGKFSIYLLHWGTEIKW